MIVENDFQFRTEDYLDLTSLCQQVMIGAAVLRGPANQLCGKQGDR